jgi:molybdate/tungstate transport system substrate-binding protein
MWEFPTSMVAATSVWIVVLLVVAAGAAGAGFAVGVLYRGSSAVAPTAVENGTLSVLAAGTLNAFFPAVASALASETPGVTAPAAAQTYEGSWDVTTAVASLGARADVAAVADFRLIPSALEPAYASYEVVFATSPEVLVYNASVPAFDGINASNWGADLVAAVATPGVAPFAVWNASTDPNGYNEIFSMMLQGVVFGGGNASVYARFYLGTPGGYATPNPSVTRIEKEAQAAALVRTGVVSAAITYRAYAVANRLSFVTFDPIVGLQANATAALDDYARLSTEILSSAGGLVTVRPAPVLFAATVPSDAPNAALGAAFLHLLVSPQGAAILGAGGAFSPIFPAWVDHTAPVPPVLAPDVVPLPPWASGLLG